jgi:hypothetical protein
MSLSLYLLAALFLPLFPLSMVFNQGLGRLRQPWLRALLLLLWPQIGVLIISQAEAQVPDWFVVWALLTAALGFSLPFALMSLLTGSLEDRMGAAHASLGGGLGVSAPRLAALFVVAVLAVVATPIFPGFFTLLATVIGQVAAAPSTALALVLIWLLWTWSGARLLHGIVVGPPREAAVKDMTTTATWGYAAGFVVLALVGIELGGVLL